MLRALGHIAYRDGTEMQGGRFCVGSRRYQQKQLTQQNDVMTPQTIPMTAGCSVSLEMYSLRSAYS